MMEKVRHCYVCVRRGTRFYRCVLLLWGLWSPPLPSPPGLGAGPLDRLDRLLLHDELDLQEALH